LAKELGVTSKGILEKCRAEGIELKNHMAALSMGLEVTIREWFSAADHATAIETTQHVDLAAESKRAASQRRRRRHEEPAQAEEVAVAEPAAPVAVETAPPVEVQAPPAAAAAVVETYPTPAPQPPPSAVQAPPEASAPPPPVAPALQAQAAAAASITAAAPAETAKQPAPATLPAQAVPNQPVRPKGIKPAGPQVVPKPAKLQGPRVVRFAGVEPQAPAPPRRYSPASRTAPPPIPAAPAGGKKGGSFVSGVEEEDTAKKGAKKRSPRRKGGGRTGETGEGLREWRDRDLAERSARLAAATGPGLRRHRASVGPGAKPELKPGSRDNQVEMAEPITIKSFSAAAGIKIADLMRKLMGHGILSNINATLARETVEMLSLEYGIELKIKSAKSAEADLEVEVQQNRQRSSENLLPRAPVITILGHVDHGKTSLLDRIRKARVAAGEEGGITQGIGAYRYDMGDKHVVFLDTPGHEAFTAMRARGANMTDVVVLVVAADDGVMPQTMEAINHAKAAKVPIVVALNKIDLPNANIQKAMGQLAEHGLSPRQWGGATEVIQTSAATGQGIDELLEVLSLEAELLELKADPKAPASGWVVEARVDSARGILARLLVIDGTLKVGDIMLAGSTVGRVRNLSDDRGKPLEQAGPATPVEVTGLDEMPEAGDRFYVMDEIARARQVAQERQLRQRQQGLTVSPQATLENMLSRIQAGQTNEIRLIIKVDVQGSLEALNHSLASAGSETVKINVLHNGVGGITEGDVLLAGASKALILGFRVVPDQRARMLADKTGVEIRTYRVIYHLLEDLEKAATGMIAPEMAEKVVGRLEVREVFKVSKVGTIAGCYVTDGTVSRQAKLRIIRNNVIVEDERTLESLRRFKEDAREVRAGLECGIKVAGYDDIKVGDILEAYQTVEVEKK
jgi:translation initiation factor IF-2